MKPLLSATLLLLVAGALLPSCSLDQLNPNAPTDEQVLSTPEGIKALAVGMQAQYAASIYDAVAVSGLVTKEYATMPSSVAGLRELETGGSDVQGFNGTVNTLWSGHYRTIKSADDLLANAPNVSLVPGTLSGIMALARTLKAMSLGDLIESYQQVPLSAGTSSSNATFADRATTLATIISLLETARDGLAATPPSTDFTSTIVGNGFDLTNTINAMIARYALITGDYAKAIAAANAVDPSKTSTLFYSSGNAPNPIYQNAILLGYYRPVRSFRLNADSGDARVAFWVSAGTATSFLGTPVDEFVQYRQDNARYYVYLPGEVTLVKAEAYARQNDLPNALIELNTILTKPADAAGIHAGLPPKTSVDLPTQQAMLDAIYRQRLYELFVSPLRFGDTRRFNQPGAETPAPTRSRTRNWLPYPDAERLANPNTPADPPI